ncbi:hypothetical protein B0H19DRAFT_1104166 [Mycena capillaripes]|nr:hypothetical protein B0H19DRAFT_1104166 [Mycena capillaripes]
MHPSSGVRARPPRLFRRQRRFECPPASRVRPTRQCEATTWAHHWLVDPSTSHTSDPQASAGIRWHHAHPRTAPSVHVEASSMEHSSSLTTAARSCPYPALKLHRLHPSLHRAVPVTTSRGPRISKLPHVASPPTRLVYSDHRPLTSPSTRATTINPHATIHLRYDPHARRMRIPHARTWPRPRHPLTLSPRPRPLPTPHTTILQPESFVTHTSRRISTSIPLFGGRAFL